MIVDNDTDLKAEKDKRLAVEEEKKKLEDRLREQDYRSQMEKSKNQQLIEEMKQAM